MTAAVRRLTITGAVAAVVAAVVLFTVQTPGRVALPVLTCHAIIEAAEADGALDDGGDLDACIAESESQPPEVQLEIAEAIFGADR